MAIVASNGAAILFCAACLSLHGYPDAANGPKGTQMIENCQAVTIRNGSAVCENHLSDSLYGTKKGISNDE